MGPKLMKSMKDICWFHCHIGIYVMVPLCIWILVIEAFLALYEYVCDWDFDPCFGIVPFYGLAIESTVVNFRTPHITVVIVPNFRQEYFERKLCSMSITASSILIYKYEQIMQAKNMRIWDPFTWRQLY